MISSETYVAAKVMADKLKKEQEACRSWMSYAKQLEAKLQEMQVKLAQSEAGHAATTALLEAYKIETPAATMRTQTQYKYKRGPRAGQPKTHGALLWEKIFDETMRKMGITNPVDYRED